MAERIWINGSLRAEEEAGVSPFDHGLTVGDGVFETLISYGEGQVPFAFTRHYQRLQHSAEAMGLAVRPRGELREASMAVLEANGMTRGPARIRITVTGGPGPLGSERRAARETTMVAAGAVAPPGESAEVVVVPFTRNENGALVGLKTTSYGENVVALAHARRRGAGEAIFANTKGQLCEGTGSNIFLVTGERVLTPPLAAGCLAGVTRGLVIELCRREGIAVAEEAVPLAALHEAEEAFLTSTTREVQPIRAVEGRQLGRVPGGITARLRAAFRNLAESNPDP